jgi:hypothetical protein
MTKKILVTGSEGYIGQHLCSLLEQRDFDVHKLDYYIEEPGAYKFEVDLRKPQDIRSSGIMYNEYDTIIHLAAVVQVGQSVEYPTAYYNTNNTNSNYPGYRGSTNQHPGLEFQSKPMYGGIPSSHNNKGQPNTNLINMDKILSSETGESSRL